MKKVNWFKNIIIFITLVSLNFTFYSSSFCAVTSAKVQISPYVYFHGFRGSPTAFYEMINKNIPASDPQAYNAGTITVSSNGTITSNLAFRKDILHPQIAVIFSNNVARLSNQVKWANTALNKIKFYATSNNYTIVKFNLVGHSMGGLVVTKLLLANENQVNSVVTFATPFKGHRLSSSDEIYAYLEGYLDKSEYSKLLRDRQNVVSKFKKNSASLAIIAKELLKKYPALIDLCDDSTELANIDKALTNHVKPLAAKVYSVYAAFDFVVSKNSALSFGTYPCIANFKSDKYYATHTLIIKHDNLSDVVNFISQKIKI